MEDILNQSLYVNCISSAACSADWSVWLLLLGLAFPVQSRLVASWYGPYQLRIPPRTSHQCQGRPTLHGAPTPCRTKGTNSKGMPGTDGTPRHCFKQIRVSGKTNSSSPRLHGGAASIILGSLHLSAGPGGPQKGRLPEREREQQWPWRSY